MAKSYEALECEMLAMIQLVTSTLRKWRFLPVGNDLTEFSGELNLVYILS